jgi:predicted RNA binding protein YcfA (HicA-like mRNA interferase family)
MAVIKTNDVIKGLAKKGFRIFQGDHTFLIFYNGDKKTSVFTKVSHGSREIADPLINKMAIQTKLDIKSFRRLVDCPMSMEEYISHLHKEGVLKE